MPQLAGDDGLFRVVEGLKPAPHREVLEHVVELHAAGHCYGAVLVVLSTEMRHPLFFIEQINCGAVHGQQAKALPALCLGSIIMVE